MKITLRITNSRPIFGLVGLLLTQGQQNLKTNMCCDVYNSLKFHNWSLKKYMTWDTHLMGEAASTVSNLLMSIYKWFLASISTSLRPNTWLKRWKRATMWCFLDLMGCSFNNKLILLDWTNLVKSTCSSLHDLRVDASVLLHHVFHKVWRNKEEKSVISSGGKYTSTFTLSTILRNLYCTWVFPFEISADDNQLHTLLLFSDQSLFIVCSHFASVIFFIYIVVMWFTRHPLQHLTCLKM